MNMTATTTGAALITGVPSYSASDDIDGSLSVRDRDKAVDKHGRPRSLGLPHVAPKSAYGVTDRKLQRSAALEAAQNAVGQVFWSKRNLYQDHAKNVPPPEVDPVTRAATWILHDPASPVAQIVLPSTFLVDSLDATQRHDIQTQADGNGAVDSVFKFFGNTSAAFAALSALWFVSAQTDLDSFRAKLVKAKSFGRLLEFSGAAGAGAFRLMVFGSMMVDRADLALGFLALSEFCTLTNYTSSIAFSGANYRDSVHQRFIEKKADTTINRPIEKLLEEARLAKIEILRNLGPVHEIEYENLRQALNVIRDEEEDEGLNGFWDFLAKWRGQKTPAEFADTLMRRAFVHTQKKFTKSEQGTEDLAEANQKFQAALVEVRKRVLAHYGTSSESQPVIDALTSTINSLELPREANPQLAREFLSLIDKTILSAAHKADESYGEIKEVIGEVSQAYAPLQRTWYEKTIDFFTFNSRGKKAAKKIDERVKAIEEEKYQPLRAEYIKKVAIATAIVRELRSNHSSSSRSGYLRLIHEQDFAQVFEAIDAEMLAETEDDALVNIRKTSEKIVTEEWEGIDRQASGRRDMTPLMIQSKSNQGIIRLASMAAAFTYAGQELGFDGALAVAESTAQFLGDVPVMGTRMLLHWVGDPTLNPFTLVDMAKDSVEPMTDQTVLDAKAALGGSIPLSIFAVAPLVAVSLLSNKRIIDELRERVKQAEIKHAEAVARGNSKEIRSTRADVVYFKLTLRSQVTKNSATALQSYPILKPVGWGVQAVASALEWTSIMFSRRKDYRATRWLSRYFGVA